MSKETDAAYARKCPKCGARPHEICRIFTAGALHQERLSDPKE